MKGLYIPMGMANKGFLGGEGDLVGDFMCVLQHPPSFKKV